MKTIFKILSLACLLSGVAFGQNDARDIGFFRFIQAVGPGEGKASLIIDGKDAFPDGYELGAMTGGVGIKAGAHTFESRKKGVDPGKTTVDLKSGETITIIAFAEKLPPKKEGDPPRWSMRLLRLKQQDAEKSFKLTLVSVCQQEEVLVSTTIESLKKQEKTGVKRLGISSVDLGRARGEVTLKLGAEPLTSVSLDEHGNYVVILYDDADGKVHAVSFLDPKFIIAG